jgi:hypothetical protein
MPLELLAGAAEAVGRVGRGGAAALAGLLRHLQLRWAQRRPRPRRPPPRRRRQGFAARGRAALLDAGADLHTSVTAYLT